MDCAQGFGEVIEYLSSVKDMGNCLNSQRSEHYCLRKDCAPQGWIDAYFLLFCSEMYCFFRYTQY